jgi:3D (Asp-Asp-Asp) domain-containing protein
MKRGVFLLGILIGTIEAFKEEVSKDPAWKDTRTSKLFEAKQADFSPRFMIHATAYCTCPICCGKWSGLNRTASGTRPFEGVTIAADKNIFPFQTCLDIPNIGERIVEDTGSAIKLFRIDVFFEDHQNAVVFGFQRNLLASFCDEEL